MKPTALFTALMLFLLPAAASAQSPYAPAVVINGQAVTYFEIDQRALLLEVLGTVGDVEKIATEQLIDDRLRIFAGKQFGVRLSDEDIKAGVSEFAGRSNFTAEQLLDVLQKEGVEPETFTDFVKNELIWRDVVTQKFQSKAFITESELDTAMALGTTAVGASVLLAELILPLKPGTENDTRELITYLSESLKTLKEFEDAVLTYSAAATRAAGGKLDWMPTTNLPADVAASVMTMGIGQVTRPIEIPNALVIFQLRGIRDNRTIAARPIAYDYATLLIPGGRSPLALQKAAEIEGKVDTCNDLQAQAVDFPHNSFNQQVTAIRSVPRNIGAELANLDANEVSTNLTQGDNGEYLLFLMLCGRTNKLSEGNREQVRNVLYSQRMEAFGKGYLQELKGDAIILYK